ncbi:MAG: AbiV family abortive infection protein [Methanobacterium sp.]
MKELSINEIEEIRIKILDNARELLEEAELLLANKRYARAYKLSHLACEEMAKIPIIVNAGIEKLRGLEVNWKQVDQKMRNHKVKIKSFLFIDFLFDFDTENDKDIKRLFDDLDMVGEYNNLKNYSLYTGRVHENFYKPSELFNEVFVVASLKLAKNRLIFFEDSEKLLQGKLKEFLKSPNFEEEAKKYFDGFYKKK